MKQKQEYKAVTQLFFLVDVTVDSAKGSKSFYRNQYYEGNKADVGALKK